MFRSLYRSLRRLFRSDEFAKNLKFFRNVPIFHGLSARQLGPVMQAMQVRHYFAGEILFREGQMGKAVFIVHSGKVEITRGKNGKKERLLGRVGAGQAFGEMALLEQCPRSANARVVEEGDIHLLYTASLEALCKTNPVIGHKLMLNMAKLLSSLLRRTNQEVDNLNDPEAA